MKRYLADTAGCIVIATIVLGFFAKLFVPQPQLIVTPDFGASDALGSFSSKFLLADALTHNRIPLWTDTLGGGFPIHAHGTIGTFFLPNLLLYHFLPLVWAYNLSLVLGIVTFGIGWYVWLRMVKLPPLPAFFAAMTLPLSGPVVTQLTHLTVIQSMSLLPWVLVSVQGLATTKKLSWALFFAWISSQQLLVGFPQSVFITQLFVCAYYFFAVYKKPQLGPALVWLVWPVCFAVLLAAIQLIPSFEYGGQLISAGGFTQYIATSFSYPLAHLVTLIAPYQLGNPKLGTYPPFTTFDGSIFWENTAFVGWIPLLLVLGGGYIWLIRRSQDTQDHKKLFFFFAITLVIALLLMTGGNSPIYFLFSFWPFNLFRVPSRFIWIFTPSLTIISALTLSILYQLPTKRWVIHGLILLCILANGTQLIWIFGNYHAIDSAATWLKPPPVAGDIGSHWLIRSIGAETAHNKVFLNAGWQNIESYRFLKNTVTADKAPLWSIHQFGDYAGRSLVRNHYVQELLDQGIQVTSNAATISALGSKLLDTYAVDTVVSALPLTAQYLQKIATYADTGAAITSYRNPTAAPPTYLAQRIIKVASVEQAYKAIASEAFIAGATALIEQDLPQKLATPSGSARLLTHNESGDTTIAVTGDTTAALLVFAQTYYPGWYAMIDNQPTRIYPVNISQTAVVVPPGDHTVTFSFIPKSFFVGAAISIVAHGLLIWATALLIFAAMRRTDQTAEPPVRHRPRSRDR